MVSHSWYASVGNRFYGFGELYRQLTEVQPPVKDEASTHAASDENAIAAAERASRITTCPAMAGLP